MRIRSATLLVAALAVVSACATVGGSGAPTDRLVDAAAAGEGATVRRLLASGADVDARGGYQGRTALHEAANEGHLAVVEQLLDAGAQVDRRDRDGVTALHLAAGAGHTQIVDRLLAAGVDVDVRSEDQAWITAGNRTALHEAAGGGHLATVERLLAAGANVDARTRDSGYRRDAPLHMAVEGGHLDIVERLLAAGAEVNARGGAERTPLHIAVRSGEGPVVERLLAAGAEVDAAMWEGRRPLHLAAGAGHTEIVDRLLAAGADPDASDGEGRTPLRTAIAEGRPEALRRLLAAGAGAGRPDLMAAHWGDRALFPVLARSLAERGELGVLLMLLPGRDDDPYLDTAQIVSRPVEIEPSADFTVFAAFENPLAMGADSGVYEFGSVSWGQSFLNEGPSLEVPMLDASDPVWSRSETEAQVRPRYVVTRATEVVAQRRLRTYRVREQYGSAVVVERRGDSVELRIDRNRVGTAPAEAMAGNVFGYSLYRGGDEPRWGSVEYFAVTRP